MQKRNIIERKQNSGLPLKYDLGLSKTLQIE